eukprot:2349361-Rhodomonas_salina.1
MSPGGRTGTRLPQTGVRIGVRGRWGMGPSGWRRMQWTALRCWWWRSQLMGKLAHYARKLLRSCCYFGRCPGQPAWWCSRTHSLS